MYLEGVYVFDIDFFVVIVVYVRCVREIFYEM